MKTTGLPTHLVELLLGKDRAMIVQNTNNLGTVFIIKLPSKEIEALKAGSLGPLMVGIGCDAFAGTTIIELVLLLKIDGEKEYSFEAYLDAADERQRSYFTALAVQESVNLLFYNEQFEQVLCVVAKAPPRDEVLKTLSKVLRILYNLPDISHL